MPRARRHRHLSASERALWNSVAQSVTPARPESFKPAPLSQAASAKAEQTPRGEPEPRRPSLEHFEIGSTAGPAASAPGPAAGIEVQGALPDRRTAARLRRGKLAPEARLDLHGMTLDRAHGALRRFMDEGAGRGRRLVLVITGKGSAEAGDLSRPARGALRRQVPLWLAQPPLSALVQHVRPAHRRHGGDGALYVYLKRRV